MVRPTFDFFFFVSRYLSMADIVGPIQSPFEVPTRNLRWDLTAHRQPYHSYRNLQLGSPLWKNAREVHSVILAGVRLICMTFEGISQNLRGKRDRDSVFYLAYPFLCNSPFPPPS